MRRRVSSGASLLPAVLLPPRRVESSDGSLPSRRFSRQRMPSGVPTGDAEGVITQPCPQRPTRAIRRVNLGGAVRRELEQPN